MRRVKYIYSGSSTRKLQVSGRQSVIISGDSDSTVFDFTFPKEYKAYTKTIIWDCYCENKDGDIINPRYLIKNDAYTVPYEITANNAGLQISFVVSLASPTGIIETSLPTPVYITRSTHTDKCRVESDVLSQLSTKAFTNAQFMLTTLEGEDPPKTYPTITFDNISDVPVATLYLTDVPYLRDGKIPKEFISTDQIVELFQIASKDDLITLTNAVSPDMAIITEGDDAGDIYILKGDSYTKPEDWTPIYSESRLKNLEKNKVDKEDGKGLSSNDYTDADKAKVDSLETTYATKAELSNKVDKVEGKGLSTNDFSNEYKAKIDDIETTYATKTELTDGLKGKVDAEEGKGLSTNDYTDADKAKVDGLEATYATKTELTDGLSKKVDTVEGKGLSTKDYTAEDQAKLAGIQENAQVNIIEVVKRNGTTLTITDKAVDVTVPTKVIQLEDAGEYATLSTDKLTNYYTTTKVDELIEEAKSGAKVEQNNAGITVGTTPLQVATDDTTGLMPSTMVVQLNKATSDITAIGTQVNNQGDAIATNAGNINSLSTELGETNTKVLELKSSLDAKQDKLTQGENITIVKNEESGETIISATAKPLAPATTTTLGGVIVGDKLSITPKGTLSVSGLGIADISDLSTQLDAKASTTYVDTELAKKQNTLTATGGLSLAENVLTIEDGYVDSKLEAGANVNIIKDTDTGKLVISATGELAVGWGNITGNIHAQSDLVSKSILTWDVGTTYAQNGMVIYSGKIYTSLVNGNVGKTPSTSPDAWKVLDTDTKPTVFTKTIGDGTSSEITVKHDLNSKNVLVALRKIDGTFVDALITAISVNEVKFSFNAPPATDSLVAIIALGAGGSSGTTVVEGFEGITWSTATPQNTWEISLAETFGDVPRPNRLLNVQTYDENGNVVIGKVTQTKDVVTVGFNRAIMGTAVLN